MTINLSIRHYSVTIAGLNCNNAVVSFTGSDTKLDNASGLVTFKGTLVLGYPEGGSFESLDDRVNDRWSRGNSLTIQLADSSGSLRLPPRGGTLHILEAAYDLKTRKLTLQVADVLELLRMREPLMNASKICLGTNSAKTEVISNLLAAAGAPQLFAGDAVPGLLSIPTPKLLDGSYIDQASAIAASAGYFLWVDTAGNVRASALDTSNRAAAFTINSSSIVQTERVAGEAPPCELVIKGKAAVVKPANDHTSSDDQQFGPLVLAGLKAGTTASPAGEMIIRETSVDDNFQRSGKQRVILTVIREPAGIVFAGDKQYAGVTDLILSSVTRETYYYEQYSPIIGNSAASLCQQGNQGRLQRHTIEIYRPAGVALKTVYASYPKTMKVDKTRLILAEQTETQYTYNLGLFVDDYSDGYAAQWTVVLGYGPKITTLKYQPIGAIDPDDFLYRSKTSLGTPEEPTPSEYTVDYYYEASPGEWKKEHQIYQSMCISNPEAAKLIRQNKAIPRNKIALLVTQLNEVDDATTISNSGQANPPAPDTYSATYTVTEKTAQIVFKMPTNAASPYRQSRRDLTFEYISATGVGLAAKYSAEAQCLALAKVWGAVLWGRYKSSSYTTDLSDSWWSYKPLTRIDVNEPQARFAYLGDGFSIAIAGKRCAVSFDGILLGQIVQTPITTPAVYDEHGTLITPAVTTTTDMISPPFINWKALQASSGSAISLTRRDYDLSPVTRSIQVASGSGLKDYQPRRISVAGAGAARGQHSTHAVRVAGGSAVDMVKSLTWAEVTPERWQQMSDRQYRKIIAPY